VRDAVRAREQRRVRLRPERVRRVPRDLRGRVGRVWSARAHRRTLETQAGVCPFGVWYGRPDELMLVTSMPLASAALHITEPAQEVGARAAARTVHVLTYKAISAYYDDPLCGRLHDWVTERSVRKR
jgi:hypothetical protein